MKNTIKIINLLRKIAKGKKIPLVIKGRLDKVYTYSDLHKDYQDSDGKLLFANLMQYKDKCLDDEVEILDAEEKNIPQVCIKVFENGEELFSIDYTGDEEAYNNQLKDFREIIDNRLNEDNEIKKVYFISDDELIDVGEHSSLNYNFIVLKQKINRLAEEFNKFRKEGK